MMSNRESCPEEPDSYADIEELMKLLSEALGLADRMELPPEIGARLQEVIDLAENCGRSVGVAR
jgi:hypothetical protein